MKTILSIALILGTGNLFAVAEDKAIDPTGTWKCEYEIGGQPRSSTLKIKKDGENLSATMSWPDQDETKVKELKLEKSGLSFTAERKLPGRNDTIIVEYKLTIDGDLLKGKGISTVGDEKREWNIQAKRQKADK